MKANDSEWRHQEIVVGALEKYVNPADTEICVNMYLPVVGQPKRRKRQCDVVIRHKSGPREYLAIVEVQKRNRKVGLKDFGDWLLKYREVGAHRLICVSEAGYSQEVVELVTSSHSAYVDLLTLREFQYLRNSEPFSILDSTVNMGYEILQCGFESIAIESSEVDQQLGRSVSVEYDPGSPILVLGQSDMRLSLAVLLDYHHSKEPKLLSLLLSQPEYSIRVHITEAVRWSIITNEGKRFIKDAVVYYKLKSKVRYEPITVEQRVYSTQNDERRIAWIARATMPKNDPAVYREFITIPSLDGFTLNIRELDSDNRIIHEYQHFIALPGEGQAPQIEVVPLGVASLARK